MKICPAGAELYHADTRTDRHDEANSRLSQSCESTQKNLSIAILHRSTFTEPQNNMDDERPDTVLRDLGFSR